ncbi:MAG: spore germination protein GerW family protein [Clostridiaceae bacterium]
MEVENVVKENLETLFQKLENFLKSETVVGQPIIVGETTLIPIVSITFGCATGAGGGGGNNSRSGSGTGSGSGSGVTSGGKITPTAVLVVKNNEVTLLPIKDKFGLENLLEKVPDLMEKIQMKQEEKKTEEK